MSLKHLDSVVNLPTIPKAEEEIMANWVGDTSKPLVSIVCHTYNHLDYIKNALDGFLMQETNFPFEIILHDDASSDGTSEIVKSYAESYPNIILPIIQTTNQWSQGIKPSEVTFPKVRGKFIALCEGDDFWCSKEKLREQLEVFNQQDDVSVCFHSAIEINELTNNSSLICNYSNVSKTIKAETIIIDRGGSMPTASLFFRSQYLDDIIETYRNAPIGDFFIQSYLALKGKVIFLPKPMCVYRRNAKGSWTSDQQHKAKQSLYYKEMIKSIDNFYGTVQDLESSNYLITPLIFYLKAFLLQDKKPTSFLRAYYEQVSTLENFKKSEITQLLVKELKSILLQKTKYILSKRRDQHEL